MDNRTERLAGGVWRIEVAPLTNAYVLADDGGSDAEGLTLVDCGTRRSGPGLVRSIRLAGLDPTAVQNLVLTHWHADHSGSAARFAASSAAPQVHVGAADLAAVQGKRRHPQRDAPPGDVTRLGRLAGRVLTAGPPVPAARALPDGRLPWAPGVHVVPSPGHTPGSVSLHLPDQGVLIAGDAVCTIGPLNRMFGPFRSARSHEPATLQRLAALDFDVLAVGHGPPRVNDPRSRLARLARRAAA